MFDPAAIRRPLEGALLQERYEQASDLDLARLARKGDEAAFEEIMRRYGPRVFRIASRFFRRREMVEEAAQEVFLKIYTEIASYEGRGSFEGWLARIATNTCINLLRAAGRRPESSVEDLTEDEIEWLERKTARSNPQPSSVESRLVAADLAEKLLETLPVDDRVALQLIDGNGLSVKEVSDMTGWSESKVKVKAMRARRRMRQALEKLLEGNTRAESAGRI